MHTVHTAVRCTSTCICILDAVGEFDSGLHFLLQHYSKTSLEYSTTVSAADYTATVNPAT